MPADQRSRLHGGCLVWVVRSPYKELHATRRPTDRSTRACAHLFGRPSFGRCQRRSNGSAPKAGSLRKAGEDLPDDGAQFRVTNDDELRWVSRAGLRPKAR